MTNKWQSFQIKNVCNVLTGGTPRTEINEYWDGDINWMSSGEVNKRRIDFVAKKITQKGLDSSNARLLPTNTVVMALAGQGKTRGKVAILNIETTCNQSLAAMVVKDPLELCPEYLFQYLESKYDELRGISGGEGRSGLNLTLINNYEIKIPDIKIQQKISDILSSIDEAIQKTDQIIRKSEELKNGLMNELLTRGIGHKKFKKTKLGETPEGWKILSLQEMLDRGMITGHLDGNHGELYPKSSEFTDAGVPYISVNNILDKRVDFTHSKYLSELRAKQFKKGVAINGDILFAHNATVGPVALLKTGYPFVVLSTSLTYYRCDPSMLNPEYLLNYMQSEMFKNQYQRVMSQTTRNQVPITAQRKLFHVVPSLEEQKTIASILSKIDEHTRINTSEKEKFSKLKSGLMQDIFNQKVQIN